MDFLQLAGKRVAVFGLANRKSVAWFVGQTLREAGADVCYVVRTHERRETAARFVEGATLYVCDVERPDEIERVAGELGRDGPLYGFVHSIARAEYGGGPMPFHETRREDFLRAVDVSCFSLVALAGAMRGVLEQEGAVVAISISTTRMASESYGYMAPIKAALDSSIVFLAKSFSRFSRIRFNAVGAGLLKTSASAGIPGYVDAYLFAEEASLRKRAVQTQEVANAAAFLLSPRASGINAQHLVVDAGMSVNYFDRGLIEKVMRP